MSVMSDLDLMVQDGERTAEDFVLRGVEPARASAMECLVRDELDGEDFYTAYETKR